LVTIFFEVINAPENSFSRDRQPLLLLSKPTVTATLLREQSQEFKWTNAAGFDSSQTQFVADTAAACGYFFSS